LAKVDLMLDNVTSFFSGFVVAATPTNLLFAFVGSLLGTLIGVLPGIGPLATISMLLSFTLLMDPLTSLIMLASIYYGASYGSSTTAILCNLPGEVSSVITCIDGHMMARNGRAGAALATAALSSLFAGCVATFLIVLFAPPLASIALSFSASEYFLLVLLGLIASIVFSHGSVLNASAMGLLGVLLGLVGTDVETGTLRYTFGIREISAGLDIVPVGMALFGLTEIIINLSNPTTRNVMMKKITHLRPSRRDFKDAALPAVRGTAIGSLLGLLPGGGAALSPFASYMLEKRVAKDPSRFGKGAIEGVAGPEAANNASAQTSFIPLLTLGIPTNPVIALMLGAMLIQGIQPGPNVITSRPDLFWGLIASMIIGNLLLVIINLPMIGIWVRLLKVPYRVLFPAIVIFCCIGAYSLNMTPIMLFIMGGFAVFGVLITILGFQPIPLLLGFVLGPLAEENLRRAFVISRGDPSIFVTRPLSIVLVLMIVALLVLVFLPTFQKSKEAFVE
jgi:putative tricarboxylic transport membrane protein